jgi:methionyl-tRNA formyltransferase
VVDAPGAGGGEQRLRLVFCGTPQFAVPSLKVLLAQPDFEIAAVFTQPDRPSGRGQQIAISPVKEIALAANIAVHQPAKIRAPEIEAQLREIAPDAIVIIAYGQIIPARLLGIPRFGWINLHASLLPRYRGAAPIHWAIAGGETRTGNTTMRIDAGMDTGEMLLQQELGIGPDETTPELSARLSEAGGPLMAETLRGLRAGTFHGRPQNHAEASVAPILKREDGRVNWSRPAAEIYNRMRGFTPWPGAYTEFRGQTCHIQGKPASNDGNTDLKGDSRGTQKDLEPGTLLVAADELNVVCGAGSVFCVSSVKLEGRKQVPAAEFLRGARLQSGERFV